MMSAGQDIRLTVMLPGKVGGDIRGRAMLPSVPNMITSDTEVFT